MWNFMFLLEIISYVWYRMSDTEASQLKAFDSFLIKVKRKKSIIFFKKVVWLKTKSIWLFQKYMMNNLLGNDSFLKS